ncbi:hypothetical protein [Pedobacter mucosus]|uniref:hypothetical protein n=1 Tax=Pedobacter mucosus TaxID=2895286 RepID=UPI001EE46D93|nr:hypothetical protein [Pedobacter mucosus]UKT66025.1 hypothetical protein LOK61_09580 [Pedobacter mucosus]
MRLGIIISLNKTIGIGIIKDLNGGKIRFHVESADTPFFVHDLVSYEIYVIESGLFAVNLNLVIAEYGKEYSFNPKNKIVN